MSQPERDYLDQENAKRLYQSDPTFKQLVDAMVDDLGMSAEEFDEGARP